jgi:hypothetical protein
MRRAVATRWIMRSKMMKATNQPNVEYGHQDAGSTNMQIGMPERKRSPIRSWIMRRA